MNGARAALDAELLAWMRERPWRYDEARFDRLARALFAFQYASCPPYTRLCESRDVSPPRLRDWREIPAVPTGAFKEMALRSFPEAATRKTFRTSGTSGEARGSLHLDTLVLYEASLLASLDTLLLPELDRPGARTRMGVLAPSPRESPDSSLSHMFGCLLAERGDEESGYLIANGELDMPATLDRVEAATRCGRPINLFGTAFAFVHLVDALAERDVRLKAPEGSRIMETGGFKGRSRVVARSELYAALSLHLGIPEARIVNQYGMTELGSQFYDSVLVDPDGPRRKLGPPWVRVRIVDPETGDPAATAAAVAVAVAVRLIPLPVQDDASGLVVVHDLANTGSVAAIQTADLGHFVAGGRGTGGGAQGFEILGRQAGAEARGCSIAADVMLAEAP